MNGIRLLGRRRRALSNMPELGECIRGSLVTMSRFCGKPNCRCQKKGQKHKAVYVSQSHEGRTKMTYIPKPAVKKAAGYIKNYRKAKGVLNAVSDINIKLLTRK